MRRMFVAVALLVQVSAVSAGEFELPDLSTLRGSSPYVPAPPTYTRWSGFYAGGSLGYGGSQFGVKGWLNNNISALSSSGFEQDGHTISLVAPGELNWALCSTDTAMYAECTDFQGNPSPVQESGGTSGSAPLARGPGCARSERPGPAGSCSRPSRTGTGWRSRERPRRGSASRTRCRA